MSGILNQQTKKQNGSWILRTGQHAAKAVWALSIGLLLAAAVAQPAAAATFTTLHVFNGTPDGAFPRGTLVQDAAGNFYGTTTSGGGDDGVIFKLDAAGHETILFNFTSSVSGADPASGLTFDAAGNLYGVADEGPGGAGVLFRLNKNGTEENFHVFEGGMGTQAAVPTGGVIFDPQGNLYGTTIAGGLGAFPGFGTIYRVDPTGKFTVLYNFKGKFDGANPQGPLVRDAAGNLYGVASAIDSEGTIKGKVFKLSPTGTLAVLHTFTGGADGSGPQPGLLMDAAGNLFGSAAKGGATGNGTIFEITKARKFSVLYSFTGGADGNSPNGELIQDPAGNIYGTTQLGPRDFALGTAFKLTPVHTLTVLHTFQGLEDGAVPTAGLIRDSAGNLYGTAIKNFLIQQVQGGSVFKIKP